MIQFGLDDFDLQVVEIFLIEIKTSPERSIRYPSLTLEEFEHAG